MRALMKTVSGLTEKHLRFDVAAFIGQLKKIEGSAPDWSGSTHPSIVIRAKALLWFSLTNMLNSNPNTWSSGELATVDQRVERDLQRFIDGAVKRRIEEARSEVLLWMLTFQAMQRTPFEDDLASRASRLIDESSFNKLAFFIKNLAPAEREEVVFEKLKNARAQLESLIPQSFESEMQKIQSEIDGANATVAL